MDNRFSNKPLDPRIPIGDSTHKSHEQLRMIFQYAAEQFTTIGLIHYDEESGSFAATDDDVFLKIIFDPYLQGILFGLCKSLEIGNPQLRETKEFKETYKILVTNLAGERIAVRAEAGLELMMLTMNREFMDGTERGYREGLALRSLQKNGPILLKHLESLVGKNKKLLEETKPLVDYIASEFMRVGLTRSDNGGSFTAVKESIFFDPRLQGLLIGLCESFQKDKPQLDTDAMTLFKLLVGTLAGAGRVSNIISSYQHNLMRDDEAVIPSAKLEGCFDGDTNKSSIFSNRLLRESVEDNRVLRKYLEGLVSRTENNR